MVVAGTRPEAVKVAPVVTEFRRHSEVATVMLNSGQHREMIRETLADFRLEPDVTLDVMEKDQSLAGLSSRLFTGVDSVLEAQKPDWIVLQGDTTTVMISALAAFYRGIRIAHIEAGLRSFDRKAPFPEEVNRQIVTRVADLHFAPTRAAYANLIREGIDPDSCFVTGNTVIDSLLQIQEQIRGRDDLLDPRIRDAAAGGKRLILITGHRRENFGRGFEDICRAVLELSQRYPDCIFVYPVHLNPHVRNVVEPMLGGREGILLLDPLPYLRFQATLNASYLVLTDSGGIQEEAPALNKPVLVMRDVTERPEGVKTGCARLVGSRTDSIVEGVSALLDDPEAYRAMARAQNPYGHGHAAARIVDAILRAGCP